MSGREQRRIGDAPRGAVGGDAPRGTARGDAPRETARVEHRPAPEDRLAARRAAELLIRRHGDALLATARRYTVSQEDAEDAYQRGLEILLTKAPAVTEAELLPWTKTVIKHEAFAIWRSRERTPSAGEDEPLELAASAAPSPVEQVESRERLRLSAEAITRLKSQEVRCLLLRAEGHSYRQICRITGFSYTKVNRCLTEGRRSFLRLVAGIESGAECDRLAPLLSSMVDGEATAGEVARLRPHLRSCLACRAALRAYRELPHRAAEVVPVAGGTALGDGPATLWRWTDSALAWVQERVALLGAKAQAATEAASASKVAAVAASTAALAGGTVAVSSLGGTPADAGGPAPDPPRRVLEGAAPPDRRAALHNEPAADEVEAEPAALIGPPPEPSSPGPPVPTPSPEPPPPPPTEPPPPAPPPESYPRNATIAVTKPEEGDFARPDGERQIDPMTIPLDRSASQPSVGAPTEEEPHGQAP